MSKRKRLARAEKVLRTVLTHEQETHMMLRNHEKKVVRLKPTGRRILQ